MQLGQGNVMLAQHNCNECLAGLPDISETSGPFPGFVDIVTDVDPPKKNVAQTRGC